MSRQFSISNGSSFRTQTAPEILKTSLLLHHQELARIETACPRSPHWRSFEKDLIEKQPYCSFCGEEAPSTQLVGHHIVPFHLNKDLELDPNNILIVGETCTTGHHHLLLCHFGNFRKWNPDARKLSEIFLSNRKQSISTFNPILIFPKG